MGQDTIVGTDLVKDALLTKTNNDIAELFVGYDALVAGSGVLVSANDTTIGYLNGKLIEGTNIILTEIDNGSDETLSIAMKGLDVLTKTANYTITTDDLGKTIRINSASDLIATLPSVGVSQDGMMVKIPKINSGKVTITPVDSDTIADGGATIYNDIATETFAFLILEYVHATTNWNISGLGTWVSTS